MAHFTKPAEGSWTEHYGIGTGPVSYEDSISPTHYEQERDAIFRRTWLNVGRVEQLPRTRSYFSRELDAACTSVIVVPPRTAAAPLSSRSTGDTARAIECRNVSAVTASFDGGEKRKPRRILNV